MRIVQFPVNVQEAELAAAQTANSSHAPGGGAHVAGQTFSDLPGG